MASYPLIQEKGPGKQMVQNQAALTGQAASDMSSEMQNAVASYKGQGS